MTLVLKNKQKSLGALNHKTRRCSKILVTKFILTILEEGEREKKINMSENSRVFFSRLVCPTCPKDGSACTRNRSEMYNDRIIFEHCAMELNCCFYIYIYACFGLHVGSTINMSSTLPTVRVVSSFLSVYLCLFHFPVF